MVKTAIVSMSEIAAQPGAPLSAEYWVNRLPGESWPAYQRRRKIEELTARAGRFEARAQRLREQAAVLQNEGSAD